MIFSSWVTTMVAASHLVGRVAVVGMPVDRWGQKLVAFVEPKAAADVKALDAHCRAAGLPGYKCPKEYVFVETIPQSSVGKILRRELRAGRYTRIG